MISGGNIFYDFFQFLMRPFAPRQPSHKVSVSSLGHDGIRPPNRYGRYNNFDEGARRPRKIPNHHKFRKGKNVIEIKKKKGDASVPHDNVRKFSYILYYQKNQIY